MSNAPREWPNVMRDLRDGAAEAIQEGVRVLEPMVMSDQSMTQTERLIRASRALAAMHKALRFLERAGACTRPE